MRKVVVPGGTGFIGRSVCSRLAGEGFDVVVLTRSPRWHGRIRDVAWDGSTLGPWTAELDGAFAVLNLAGRTVNCRYNERNKREILDSRVVSTRVIGQAIARCAEPPEIWINSSTATIYRHAEDRAMDEETGELGEDFSMGVAKAWEEALFEPALNARRIAIRSGMVMGAGKGGPFHAFLSLARKGLGGHSGSGSQMVSWIHERDFLSAILFLLDNPLNGVVNVTAPNPIPNREFMREIVKACGAKLALPSPQWLLGIGARIVGTETELVLKSRWVVPKRLLDAGFEFRFPEWPDAARDLVARS